MGTVERIHTSRGGVPKLPVAEAVIGTLGIEGDAVKHTRIHGGPERALCLFSADVLDALRAEGHPIEPGMIGENLLLRGIDFGRLREGVRLRLGTSIEVELTRPTTPCDTIAAAFTDGYFNRIHHAKHPADTRWYCRVVSGGRLRPGDPAVVLA
jgi:MOSC domain-containing protein YiiM